MGLPPDRSRREQGIQLNSHGSGPMSGFVAECEGFLLGPRGEVWDLHPWVGYEPRLLVETIDERPTLCHHPAARELRFSLFHQTRYLALFAVTEDLEPGIRCWQAQKGQLELGVADGAPAILGHWNGFGERALLARLDREHWVSAARTPYMLVCQRSADLKRLLAFSRQFDLKQGKAPLWSQPVESGPRGRLSGLADRHLPGLPQLAALRRLAPIPAVAL